MEQSEDVAALKIQLHMRKKSYWQYLLHTRIRSASGHWPIKRVSWWRLKKESTPSVDDVYPCSSLPKPRWGTIKGKNVDTHLVTWRLYGQKTRKPHRQAMDIKSCAGSNASPLQTARFTLNVLDEARDERELCFALRTLELGVIMCCRVQVCVETGQS